MPGENMDYDPDTPLFLPHAECSICENPDPHGTTCHERTCHPGRVCRPAGYWCKGSPKDPGHGQPHRHTRAKIQLLLPYLSNGDVEAVLLKVAQRHPDTVLQVMCDLIDDREEVPDNG